MQSFDSNGDASIWVRNSRERRKTTYKQTNIKKKKSVVSWKYRATRAFLFPKQKLPTDISIVVVKNTTYQHILIHSCNDPFCSCTQTDTKYHKLGIYMVFHKIFRYNPWDRLYRYKKSRIVTLFHSWIIISTLNFIEG